MRWKNKYPSEGDVRIKTRFALFPITIGLENRWMELVRLRQVYRPYDFPCRFTGKVRTSLRWENDKFDDFRPKGVDK